MDEKKDLVCVIAGSQSDSAIVEKCTKMLDSLVIPYSVHYASAHRTPDKVMTLMQSSSADVFIGIAGLAAHLPGVMAAHTTKTVIGVPVSANLGGLDALLSIVQMPKSVPVATVGIDRGDNAALLAAQILAVKYDTIHNSVKDYRKKVSGGN